MTKPQGPQDLTPAFEPAQRLVQRCQVTADAAHSPDRAITRRVRHGDVNAVPVQLKTDVQGARFTLHGPTPRKLATPRQPVRRAPGCSSVGPVPASYGIAGVGPPESATPSCLGVAAPCVLGS